MQVAGERTTVTLFLCGDVMLGRGIDQVLAHPGEPALRESYLTDARDYVELAERLNGRIPAPVPPAYVWGAALEELERAAPEVRIVNLETSVTTSDLYWPGKGIHYRLQPANVAAITAARIEACALANNHVLDFDRRGLLETLDVLRRAGVRTAGAGATLEEARAPARAPLSGGGNLLLFSMGDDTSGISSDWAATTSNPGVDYLPDLSEATAAEVAARIGAVRREGDLCVASIHWGTNWGYRVAGAQTAFAHRLIDGGVDLVHGHSSHHPRPLELYRGKLILYGCGDFINDYEGIAGYEAFRDDLRVMYFPSLKRRTGELESLRLVVLQTRRFALVRASPADVDWLRVTVSEASQRFGVRLLNGEEDSLVLAPA